jgi:hypothetical protein
MPKGQVTITSFGYGHSLPPEADVTVDARRLLLDPHVDPAMREMTGLDETVRRHVLATRGAKAWVEHEAASVRALLAHVGRSVTVAFGCAGVHIDRRPGCPRRAAGASPSQPFQQGGSSMHEDNAIRMQAKELEMRYQSGGRFRLVAVGRMRPPRMGDQWPLITLVDYTDDDGPLQVVVLTETTPEEGYGTRPQGMVVVIPVYPEQASRSTLATSEAVRA